MSSISNEFLESLINNSIINTLNDLNITIDLSKGLNTILYGKESPIDSIVLVNIIIDLEENIVNALNIQIQIANDAAFSSRKSPFRTIKSLIDFVSIQIEAQK